MWWIVVGVEVGVEGGAVVWWVEVILTVGVSWLFCSISTMIQAYTYACIFYFILFFSLIGHLFKFEPLGS